MKSLIVAVMLLMSLVVWNVPAFCGVNPDFSDLTDAEKAKLVLEADKLKNSRSPLEKVTTETSNAAKVNEWVDVGKNLGLALTSTAKELGVAMDAFLSSRTGTIATYIILWKLLWKDVVGVIVGLIILLVFIPIWLYSYRRMCIFKNKRVIMPSDKSEKKEVIYTYYDKGEVDGTRLLMWILFIFILIMDTLLIFK